EEIWISTSAGAWCFTKNWQPKYGGRCFYAGSSITRIMKDREGSYWFGTLNNGVMVVPNINALLFRHKNHAITALAISHREQAVFAGTSANAVLRFNPVVNTFSELYQAPGTQEVLHVYADEEAGRMLVSSEKTRVYRQQALQKDLVLGIKNVCRLNSAFYAAAFSGGYGLLPAANNGNVRPPDWLPVHPIDDQKFYRLNEQDIRGRWVCFTEKDSTLYAAAADGLHYYSPRGRGMVRFAGKDIYPSHLVADGVQVFAATFSEGLFRVAGNKAIPVTGTNRPVMRSIHRICYDGRFIWAAGDAVLQKINHNTGEVIEYTYADGLPRAELKDVQVQNGMVYLATTLGMVVFSGNAASENKTPPLLVLNRVMVNDRVVNLDETNKFSWAQNNISIHFSALAFKAEEWVQVQYRINNGQWNNLNDGARVINLSALSPGNYTISIRAFNEDRVVSVQPVQLTFSIAPPFYKTLWFVSLVLASATALVYIYFRSKLNNEKRNAELLKQKMILEQELHQSMMASIKSQMNPHFLFNALNTIQAYIYTNEKEQASLYLGKFSELTRMVLDMSNKERVSLAQEIKALQLYLELEQLRFEDKLHYTFTVDEQIGTETVFIPAMLIQPYVENAIKHGLMHLRGVWQLDISFVLAGSVIEVTIEDNGVGRKASAAINAQRSRRHRSFAAGANQKRLDILNKGNQAAIALEITDKEDTHGPAGTRVTLRIPVAGR
ncbi:MAG: histidine kinase, partial [Dinghuibacter sp.]|nr:histidine kinase [Dinghuibacter sp.]